MYSMTIGRQCSHDMKVAFVIVGYHTTIRSYSTTQVEETPMQNKGRKEKEISALVYNRILDTVLLPFVGCPIHARQRLHSSVLG